jgi:3',5'-cyclic AMP phosphodiesterase CpdA
MSLARPASSAQQRITLHHVSDLHYQHRSRSNTGGDAGVPKDDLLVTYRGYLERLEPEGRPDLLVITGDLTATGSAGDLGTVQEILRNDVPSWAGRLSEHIFVVPGPRDVN